MSKIFKICFLDIDGVLNSATYFENRSDEDDRSYPLSEFDPYTISRINQILGYCDQLVLSSDWRYTEGIERILSKVGISQKAVDNMETTPYLGHVFKDCLRGHEIDFVVKKFKGIHEKINYVILDDLLEFQRFQRSHLVHTTFKDGLTDKHMEKAIEILMDTGLYI